MISPESVADKIAMSKNERIKQDDIELEKSYAEALDRGYSLFLAASVFLST